MNQKEKMALIIQGVSKMFLCIGKEPSELVLKAFADELIQYDIKCLLTAIQEFITNGDPFPSVSKIIEIYSGIKNRKLWELFNNTIKKAGDGTLTEREREILIDISTETYIGMSDKELYMNYQVNDSYKESRFEKFKGYFKDEPKQIQVESDILTLANNQKQIG